MDAIPISLNFPPYTLTLTEIDSLISGPSVHSTYFGSEDYPGTGVWVHEHVTDEVDEKLMTLPFGVDNKTICKNLETGSCVLSALGYVSRL